MTTKLIDSANGLNLSEAFTAKVQKALNEELAQVVDVGDHEKTLILIKNGANVNAMVDVHQWSQDHLTECPILRSAIKKGHVEIVKTLLENGAKATALMYYNHTEGSQFSGREYKVYKGGMLTVAAEQGNEEIVKMLIAYGADVNPVMIYGKSPLHLAAEGGHVEAMSALINHKANIEARDYDDRTPAWYAWKGGHIRAVELLARHGAALEVLVKRERCNLLQGLNASDIRYIQQARADYLGAQEGAELIAQPA